MDCAERHRNWNENRSDARHQTARRDHSTDSDAHELHAQVECGRCDAVTEFDGRARQHRCCSKGQFNATCASL
jgi:hypothetical protein